MSYLNISTDKNNSFKNDINNLKSRVGEETFWTLLWDKETKDKDIEDKKKNKWIMEITPNSTWVEHPKDYDFENFQSKQFN